jgi:hypothetical protein
MRFLFFNVVVLAALYMLAVKDGEQPEILSAGLKSTRTMISEFAVTATDKNEILGNKISALPAKEKHIPALPADEIVKDMGLKPINAGEFSIKPLTDEEKRSYADNKTLPPSPPTSLAATETGTENEKPHLPKEMGRVQVAEGQIFMSPETRRKELNALARDMETIFLKKISE